MVQEQHLTTTPGQEVADAARKELAQRAPEALMVSEAYVQQTTTSIARLQNMVRTLLVRGRDYGRTPGTPADSLWDPGASLIVGGFNCYFGRRRVLSLVDNLKKISVIVEVPIISRQTGLEVGSGIGAASSRETKHHWRYFTTEELNDMGIPTGESDLKSYHKGKNHPGEYGIENPEWEELLHTLITMGSKRGEVDGAKALPGVSSVLREMFDPELEKKLRARGTGKTEGEGPKWTAYHGARVRLGYSEAEAWAALKVKSMHDWLATGKSLDDALGELTRLAAEESGMTDSGVHPPKGAQPPPGPEGHQEEPGENTRKVDAQMLQAAIKKLAWDPKRQTKELRERTGFGYIADIPDDKLHEVASKLTTLAEAA